MDSLSGRSKELNRWAISQCFQEWGWQKAIPLLFTPGLHLISEVLTTESIMKTLPKYGTALIAVSTALLLLYAFMIDAKETSPLHNTAQSVLAIPELLIREDGLKQTAEWESNVHRVSELSDRLIKHPNNAAALVELGQIYCIEARVTGEHGHYSPGILRMVDRALGQEDLDAKTRFEATTLKANVLLAQHRWHEGLEWAERAYALNGHSSEVYAALIDANVELGQYDRAVELTDKLMQVRPGLTAYARASYLRELHGDIDGAIEAMKHAVEAGYPGYENTEWCRVRLGELLEEKGDLHSAEAVYRMSMQNRDHNPFAMAAIGRIYTKQGRFAEAESMISCALEIVPEISFQEDLFSLYEEWGDAEKAQRAYTGMIEMVENDAAHGLEADLDYAIILYTYGNDIDAALEKALRAYEVRPDNIAVNGLLAKIYAARGEKDRAKKHLEVATRTGYLTGDLQRLSEDLG